MKKSYILIFAAVLVPSTVFAHSGRTNQDGCHTNNKTGEYHCHAKKQKSSRTQARTYARTSEKSIASDEKVFECSYNFYNCSDFTYQNEAQSVLEACGMRRDIHDLDRDHDGLACESL